MEEINVSRWYDEQDGDPCSCVCFHSNSISSIMFGFDEYVFGLQKEDPDDFPFKDWGAIGRELISVNQFDIWTNGVKGDESNMFQGVIIELFSRYLKDQNTFGLIDLDWKSSYIPLFDEFYPENLVKVFGDLGKINTNGIYFYDNEHISEKIISGSNKYLDVMSMLIEKDIDKVKSFIKMNHRTGSTRY